MQSAKLRLKLPNFPVWLFTVHNTNLSGKLHSLFRKIWIGPIYISLQISANQLHIRHQRAAVWKGSIRPSSFPTNARWIWQNWNASIRGRRFAGPRARAASCFASTARHYILQTSRRRVECWRGWSRGTQKVIVWGKSTLSNPLWIWFNTCLTNRLTIVTNLYRSETPILSINYLLNIKLYPSVLLWMVKPSRPLSYC